MYCKAMDQVKKGSKALVDFVFKRSWLKNGNQISNPSYATSSSKVGELHYLRSDEKSSDIQGLKLALANSQNASENKKSRVQSTNLSHFFASSKQLS